MPIAWLTGSPSFDEPVAIAHSEQEGFDGQTWTAQVALKCAWDQRYLVFNNIIDNELVWPYAPDGNIKAVSGVIKPFQRVKNIKDGQGNQYLWAQLDMQFSWQGGVTPGGPGEEVVGSFEESFEPNAEMTKVNPKNGKNQQEFFWETSGGGAADEDNPVDADEAPTRLEGGFDWVVKYTKLASIPAAAFTHKNKVNNANVVSATLGVTFATDTLRLAEVNSSRAVVPGDPESLLYDLTMRWAWRQNGWNKYWNKKTQSYRHMYWVGPGPSDDEIYYNYPQVSMSGLVP